MCTLVWAITAIYEASASCVNDSAFIFGFGNYSSLTSSTGFYVEMALMSLLSTLANYHWSSNKKKAEKEESRKLALMLNSS